MSKLNLLSTNPILAKEWHPTKNGSLTPNDVTSGSDKKVWWLCKKEHEWNAAISMRTRGRGCPYCSNKAVNSQNCLATINPKLSREWHPTKNGSLTPNDIVFGSSKKVWWLCKKDRTHEWEAIVSDRNYGRGCPYCTNRIASSKNCLLAVRPEIAKEWHPTKNGSLTPTQVTFGSSKKVWWLCKINNLHEWKATVNSRTYQSGCPYCASRAVNSQNCLLAVQPELAKEWHPTKNDSLTPNDVLPWSSKKVWWICKKNKTHEWRASISNRTRGTGCPFCVNHIINAENCLFAVRPELAKEWHPTKNGSLTPNDVSFGSSKKVWWICKKDKTHKWEATVASRSAGSRCPFCHSSTSEPELRIYTELKGIFQNVEHRKKINRIECDIFIPNIMVAIEVDGARWHLGKIDLDKKKNAQLKNAGITLIRVRDKGLPRISEIDIIHSLKSPSFSLIKTILQSIIKTRNISDTMKNRINIYIKSNTFQGENEYKKLLNMLPSALPGTSLLEKLPKLAEEWNSTKNGLLTPQDVALFSNKKVWWICRKDKTHEWKAQIINRAYGSGCPYCAGHAVNAQNCLLSVRPELAKEWHPTKNGSLTPTDVTSGSNNKIWWLCNKDNTHEWKALLNNRTKGSGCPYCANQAVNSQNCLITIQPEVAKEWHPTKNGSLNPNNVTSGSSKKVWWLCKKDETHEWEAVINDRTNGSCCPYCTNRTANSQNCLLAVRPELAKEWHPIKNSSLTPNDVLPGARKKVWWLCKKDGTHEWEARVSDRTRGSGCPVCSQMKRENTQQKTWDSQKNSNIRKTISK